jgi:sulfite reductase (NADPH) flavoprotein alpha-component
MDNTSLALSDEQLQQLKTLVANLNREQLIWLSGYVAGHLEQGRHEGDNPVQAAISQEPKTEDVPVASSTNELTVIFGTRTGNSEKLAYKAAEIAKEKGLNVTVKDAGKYKTKDLQNEKNLIIICSTHGDGVPPFAARELHEFIYSKRAPKLENTTFAVLGLGDSSYFQFCKAAKDFDEQLERLGAKRLVPRIACDVDFDEDADKWLRTTIDAFAGSAAPVTKAAPQFRLVTDKPAQPKPATQVFSKKNPFLAPVFEKVNLHGRGSDRQTIHIELGADSKVINYQPGDSAGVIPVNSVDLINEVLQTTKLDGDTVLEYEGGKLSLREILYSKVELSKITKDVLGKYFILFPNDKLRTLIDNPDKLKNYINGRDIVDMLLDFPTKVYAEDLVKILRPLQPRYYSISSSPLACPGELHLTVGVVNYEKAGRVKKGTCSSFLSEVEIENEEVPIFIESNPGFRLPENKRTPIIMIGAGTGIAPYRAFVQHRDAEGSAGKSWLFFGNRNFETEFLYQTEWQEYLKTGVLTKMDVAFSRDTEEKIYVQHKLLENAKEVYDWIEEGANIYICGDMKYMANDVQNALNEIVQKQGKMSANDASAYLDNLQHEKRLQLDVY